MNNDSRSDEQQLAELQESGEAIGKLAEDADRFGRVVEAFRSRDTDRFQAELSEIGLLERCRLVCRWLCSKHCVFTCLKFCGPIEPRDDIDIGEMREFALATARISQDEELLRRLLDALDQEEAEAFRSLIRELKLERFCHQLCHWLCFVRCHRVCELLCPPRPVITEVGFIPTSQINPQGFGSGPSFPPGPTQADDKPGGVGDHPFGGWANIRGAFVIPAPYQYKVESADNPAGPWTPILQPINDYRISATFPFPVFDYFTRVPNAAGWYNIGNVVVGPDTGPGMGLAGADYLTDWLTNSVPDGLHYVKLTVRSVALTEFDSLIVPVLVDNTQPTKPVILLELQEPNGTTRKLDCCDTVERGAGNLVRITLQAWDTNFSSISATLIGGCGFSLSIVDTGGVPLSKTYSGNTADTGYPVPTAFLWDPWAAGIDRCCYVIDVRIYDRAVINNHWSGGHGNENWHSITIG